MLSCWVKKWRERKKGKKGEKRFRNGDFCRRRYAMRCRFFSPRVFLTSLHISKAVMTITSRSHAMVWVLKWLKSHPTTHTYPFTKMTLFSSFVRRRHRRRCFAAIAIYSLLSHDDVNGKKNSSSSSSSRNRRKKSAHMKIHFRVRGLKWMGRMSEWVSEVE